MSRKCQLRLFALSAAVIVCFLAVGCNPPGAHSISGPRLRVLGTVQDGGLPHAACSCRNCQRARTDPRERRFVASLALILPKADGGEKTYLIDATPDVRAQLDLLRDVHHPALNGVDRSPVDGVFLTHAHIGHYLGLAFFGFEAVNTRDLPVYCTPRMARFLRDNGPWSELVRLENVNLHEVEPGNSFLLPGGRDGGVKITPIRVPHRGEYSDTVAYVFRREHQAPAHALLYLPDTEPWPTWKPSLLEVIEREHIQTLLVDGTFFSADELPGRPASSIGHPLMPDSMQILEPLVRQKRLAVYFMHLNHSNPALDRASAAYKQINSRGFHVAVEGQEFAL